ncbi:hypothetical protein Pcinc_037831 [Petrolisthes cinctipes]|uniref:Uncharacterized protein n=1 Tax=Petrolisthes cinctipes TaxID=88211 RepID=A0AAE1ENK8_PETCI|nr:hypothetical protein Pcinc_037831 [Petrolisthes cinctipes]
MVERLKDGFGYYYKVYGYALGNEEDYKLIPVTTPCECRRWCQVSTKCHSVSVVKVAGVGVECRVSNRPVGLTDINDRPRLNKTHQAMHFLSADQTTWEELGQTGVKFRESGNRYYWSYCITNFCTGLAKCLHGSCSFAVLNTWDLLEDAVALVPAGRILSINLHRPAVGEEAAWGEGFGRQAVLHSASEINTTTVNDKTPQLAYSGFTFSHDGRTFAFDGTKSTYRQCLCMDNPLNLEL